MSDDEDLDKPTMKFFPRNWSTIENADVIPTPTREPCVECVMPIEADEYGLSLPCTPYLREMHDGSGYGGEIRVVYYHRRCFLKALGIKLMCIPLDGD